MHDGIRRGLARSVPEAEHEDIRALGGSAAAAVEGWNVVQHSPGPPRCTLAQLCTALLEIMSQLGQLDTAHREYVS